MPRFHRIRYPLDREFYFFAILIALAWKRQTNHPNLPDTETFRDFKQLFSYDRLHTISQEVLTSDAWSLSETDIDYLFLVYLTLNTPLLKTNGHQKISSKP
ncbi:M protein trans-acting positive regulator PRD domain-containing protein [Streptococcus dysgalactiae]|uniref:M protein trans-acting positive regulator PRD domain-containing protein n=1 Tax=Streptococcus dysgalactiae TaxID=1334 RepID=UPI0010D8510B|nr:M protein trans-acting positive regulator PRD domain-containing protein [Streptococcus dysgalactiae]VTS95043.1 transcriptional regulator [Streptococcus dysgalactiae subsp. equisimilis]